MMESPEVLREPAIAVPHSRRTVEEVSDADADTPRGATLPPAVAATTPHHTIATPHHTSSGAGAMEEDDSDDVSSTGSRTLNDRGDGYDSNASSTV